MKEDLVYTMGDTFLFTNEGTVLKYYNTINGRIAVFNPHNEKGYEIVDRKNVLATVNMSSNIFETLFKSFCAELKNLPPLVSEYISLCYNEKYTEIALLTEQYDELENEVEQALIKLGNSDSPFSIAARVMYHIVYTENINFMKFDQEFIDGKIRYPEGFTRDGCARPIKNIFS